MPAKKSAVSISSTTTQAAKMDKPVIGFGNYEDMRKMRQKAMAFDLLVTGGFLSPKKAQQAMEIASVL